MTPQNRTLSFERFMSEALYHPEKGYYANHIRDVGRGGDFSTSATLHPDFAKAIAHWAWKAAPWRNGRKHLIEVGAGNGILAAAIRQSLCLRRRLFLKYHIVEVSPRLRSLQQKRLGNKARWHASVSDALKACDGHAALFSNEVPDAMPCRILVKQHDRWRELLLCETAEGWRESFGECPDESSSAMERLDSWPEGQRIEVGFAFRDWQQSWAPEWKRGSMLTIDYGGTVETLYHRRPRGTLRAYFHHQRVEGPECYSRFGRQDLTADVNFTDLVRWGEELGWQTLALDTQREFLLKQLPSLQQKAATDPGLAFLLDEYGAGGCFYALIQTK